MSLELNLDHPLARNLELCLLAGNRACRGSNTWLDISPKRNHGALVNKSPTDDWMGDEERDSLYFGGGNGNYVSTTTNAITGERSIGCWFKIDPSAYANNYDMLVTEADTWMGLAYQPAYTQVLYYDGDRTTRGRISVNLKDGRWHHAVATITNNLPTLFVDGINNGQVDTSTIITTPQGISVGARYSGSLVRVGLIDMVMAASRVWTSDEIAEIYEATKDCGYGTLVRQKKYEKPTNRFFFYESLIPKSVCTPIQKTDIGNVTIGGPVAATYNRNTYIQDGITMNELGRTRVAR